jgi:transcriptional regulator with XRE-family HTH domain
MEAAPALGDDGGMARRPGYGDLLRDFRERRRASQLALARDAEISTRHLSFLETGRSAPSREMVLRLARVLDVPLRVRNAMLHAAGFAPAYAERPIDDPALAPARRAIDLVLKGHEPFPALAVDRHWNLVAKNRAIEPLMALAHPSLLEPPVNVLVLSLHPKGLASRIQNLGEWRGHLLGRLERQIEASGDPKLEELLRLLHDLPGPPHAEEQAEDPLGGIAVPLTIDLGDGPRSFISTTTVFGTSVEVTLSELTLECFFPV